MSPLVVNESREALLERRRPVLQKATVEAGREKRRRRQLAAVRGARDEVARVLRERGPSLEAASSTVRR
jgi:hypothetical protein